MKLLFKTTVSVGILCLTAGAAMAACEIEGAGSVRILSNDFDVLKVVADGAKECASDKVTVTSNLTTEHKNLQVPALSINPAEYTVAVVANGSIAPLLAADLIRPLDDLIAKYGQDLLPTQLIKVDGQTVAVAFSGNSQHLFYRKDILDEAGVAVPSSYEDVLAAAEIIKEKGILDYPLAAANKPGWDLGAEFVNMYLGTGAEFFEPGSAKLAIGGEDGIKTLEMMKALTAYMPPDYMTYDADEMKAAYLAGRVAMMDGWGSYSNSVIGAESPDQDIAANTVLAAAPTFNGGDIPAAALWWDGFSIAKNISDEDAETSFQAMAYAIRPDIATTHPDVAPWLLKGYEPGPSAAGVIATASAGARPYPMLPYMGLLHTALSDEIGDYLQGSKTAEQTLNDINAAYNAAAQQGGFITQ
ncbi:extracellular solute-binding protein [Devosia sp. YIM 151766]|uniref:ABC transporter substrate-binding protein n=1 Tax=Devosia sp. YIM 151766 TaxID=3017325 RepID=UPI00255CD44B|nr:extracellular solute-binding protein [Devosia sp. YIM 151766]WIY53273.1 extracellular solute-binding protein [Devosia sp. YIM 151766]